MNRVIISHLSKEYDSGAGPRRVLVEMSRSRSRPAARWRSWDRRARVRARWLNIAGTLDRPTSGTVDIFGSDPFKLNDRQLAAFRNTTIGFVFQAHHLLPQCSILENVLLPSLIAPPDATREAPNVRALRLIERVGLTSRMHARPAQLSGGERQRAAVVRALINAPRLLLADEPTGSLDRASAESIGALLSELRREENAALIVVTHSEALAQRMDKTMVLNDGVLA